MEFSELLLMILSLGGNANPWVTSIVVLIIGIWRWGYPQAVSLWKRYFVYELELDSQRNLREFISEYAYENVDQSKLRGILVSLSESKVMGMNKLVPKFLPSLGTHTFRWNGYKFSLDIDDEESTSQRNVLGPESKKTNRDFVLSYTGKSSKPLKDFITALIDEKNKNMDGKISITTLDSYGDEWGVAYSVDKRDLDSVHLEPTIREAIVSDIAEWRSNRHWYTNMGIPYRRGYMFYGPPGCGKSSLAKALASHFEMKLYVLSLSSKKMDDSVLSSLMTTTQDDSIILLEDIDSVFVEREKGEDNLSSVTFSGLLNAVDGVSAREANILITTTNHIERLDPALLRPGRMDLRLKLDFAIHSQIVEMFLKFFPIEMDLANEFASRIPERKYSLATIQNHLIKYKDDPRRSIERLDELLAGE